MVVELWSDGGVMEWWWSDGVVVELWSGGGQEYQGLDAANGLFDRGELCEYGEYRHEDSQNYRGTKK